MSIKLTRMMRSNLLHQPFNGCSRLRIKSRSSGTTCSAFRSRGINEPCNRKATAAANLLQSPPHLFGIRPRWHPVRKLLQPDRSVQAQAFPIEIFPVQSPWGVWFVLMFAGAFGLWSERTKLGKDLSGALVATLAGMFFANIGVLPVGAPEYSVVNKFLLPLAIPMLLFAADIRRVVRDAGRLLGAFFVGAFATIVGSVVAMWAVPMEALAGEGWKIAAALTARHIGGAVNYVAVSETLEISPSATGAGLAADDLILAIYFSTIYSLAKSIPPEPSAALADTSAPGHGTSYAGKTITVFDGMSALTVSVLICCLAAVVAKVFHLPGQFITIVTAITVLLASLIPNQLAPLVRSGEGLAQILMQVFFATVGASARIAETVHTGPTLFAFSVVALAVHLGVTLVVGRLLGYSRQELLLASNANIGGPATVAGMAAAKGWPSRMVPAVLASTMGYALGTFTGMLLGFTVLKPMDGAAI